MKRRRWFVALWDSSLPPFVNLAPLALPTKGVAHRSPLSGSEDGEGVAQSVNLIYQRIQSCGVTLKVITVKAEVLLRRDP